MRLQTLTLRQFRSYRDLTLQVNSGVNLFLGANGAGKTNILEAIAVLATGSSPRGSETDSLTEWGQNGFYLGGQFGYDEEGMEPILLEMKFQAGSPRVIRQNKQIVVRLKDLIGRVPIVSFVPEDLALIKGEPVLRRRAMNMILMQGDPVYAAELKNYNDTVRARNAALKQLADGQISTNAIEPWNISLAKSGLVLCQTRDAFIQDFSLRVGDIHRRMSGQKETMRIEYKPSFPGPWDENQEERWLNKLWSIRAQEMALGTTMMGPHRDDIAFLLNDRSAKSFGSEGQKRTGAVAFKLAEIPYIQEKRSQKPICLLDDVLSELDADRAAHLLDELTRTGQCFVTLTGLESWPRDRALPASVYRVDETGVRAETCAEEPLAL